MKTYLQLLEKVLVEGTERTDRTGTGTLSIFGAQMRYALDDGFPAVTTRNFTSRAWHTNYFGFFAERPISIG